MTKPRANAKPKHLTRADYQELAARAYALVQRTLEIAEVSPWKNLWRREAIKAQTASAIAYEQAMKKARA